MSARPQPGAPPRRIGTDTEESTATLAAIDGLRAIVERFHGLGIWLDYQDTLARIADRLEAAERRVGRRL